MTIDVGAQRPTLSAQVAEEIRVAMTRKRVSGRQLAQTLGVSPSWVSYRLSGVQPIDLNDLERIARALAVDVAALIPSSSRVTPQESRLGPAVANRLGGYPVGRAHPGGSRRPGKMLTPVAA